MSFWESVLTIVAGVLLFVAVVVAVGNAVNEREERRRAACNVLASQHLDEAGIKALVEVCRQ